MLKGLQGDYPWMLNNSIFKITRLQYELLNPKDKPPFSVLE